MCLGEYYSEIASLLSNFIFSVIPVPRGDMSATSIYSDTSSNDF